MKLGIVYEIRKNKVVVLTPDCEFMVIKRRKDMYLGQQVKFNIQDVKSTTKPMHKYASIAASIAAAFVMVFLHFKVLPYGEIYGYIDVDINPSIELVVDKEFEVLKTKALNEDAKKITKELEAKGKDAYSVINDFLDKCEEYGYIDPQGDNVVLVSASIDDSAAKDSEENQELDKFLFNIDKKINIENKENITSRVIKVSPEDRKKAVKNNLSMGKYYLMEKAKVKGINLSAEEKVSELLAVLDAEDGKWDSMSKAAAADLRDENAKEFDNKTKEQEEPVTTPVVQVTPEPMVEATFKPAVNPTPEPTIEPTTKTEEMPDELPASGQKNVVATPKVKKSNTAKPTAKVKSEDAVNEGSLKIKLLSKRKEPKAETIVSDFHIINTSGKDIDLTKVKVRYYFTREGRADLEPSVYHYSIRGTKDESRFRQLNNNDVKISFHKVSGSDMYMEIEFASGVLKKDEYVYIMTAFNNTKWDRFEQDNDYSYIPDCDDFTVTEKVTAYISDKLVWGKEPY